MMHRLRSAMTFSRLVAPGIVSMAALSVCPAASRAQPASAATADETPADFWPVRDGIYLLVGHGANITASVGPDGILLVDTGDASSSAAVVAALRRLEESTAYGLEGVSSAEREIAGAQGRLVMEPGLSPAVEHVINTVPRAGHTGGNAALAEGSPAGMSVIAHENTLLRLVNADRSFDTLPTHALWQGEYEVTGGFNGESIRVAHMPSATTDGDLIVYFRRSDVISAGDVISMESFPVIDVDRGGSIDGCIRALDNILNLAIAGPNLEGGTLIIPGHGRLAEVADVGRYRDMLVIIRDQIQHGIDSGLTLREIQAQRPALGYEDRFGADDGPWTTEMFVEAVYRSLTQGAR